MSATRDPNNSSTSSSSSSSKKMVVNTGSSGTETKEMKSSTSESKEIKLFESSSSPAFFSCDSVIESKEKTEQEIAFDNLLPSLLRIVRITSECSRDPSLLKLQRQWIPAFEKMRHEVSKLAIFDDIQRHWLARPSLARLKLFYKLKETFPTISSAKIDRISLCIANLICHYPLIDILESKESLENIKDMVSQDELMDLVIKDTSTKGAFIPYTKVRFEQNMAQLLLCIDHLSNLEIKTTTNISLQIKAITHFYNAYMAISNNYGQKFIATEPTLKEFLFQLPCFIDAFNTKLLENFKAADAELIKNPSMVEIMSFSSPTVWGNLINEIIEQGKELINHTLRTIMDPKLQGFPGEGIRITTKKALVNILPESFHKLKLANVTQERAALEKEFEKLKAEVKLDDEKKSDAMFKLKKSTPWIALESKKKALDSTATLLNYCNTKIKKPFLATTPLSCETLLRLAENTDSKLTKNKVATPHLGRLKTLVERFALFAFIQEKARLIEHALIEFRKDKNALFIAISAIQDISDWIHECASDSLKDEMKRILTNVVYEDLFRFSQQAMHIIDDFLATEKINIFQAELFLTCQQTLRVYQDFLSKPTFCTNPASVAPLSTTRTWKLISPYMPEMLNDSVIICLSSIQHTTAYLKQIKLACEKEDVDNLNLVIESLQNDSISKVCPYKKAKFTYLLKGLGQSIGNFQRNSNLLIAVLPEFFSKQEFENINQLCETSQDFRSYLKHRWHHINNLRAKMMLTEISANYDTLCQELDTLKGIVLSQCNTLGLKQPEMWKMYFEEIPKGEPEPDRACQIQ